MSDEPGTLCKVAWPEVFKGAILLRALRLAMSFRVLLLAALGIAGTIAGWIVIGGPLADPDNPALNDRINSIAHWPWQGPGSPLDRLEISGPVDSAGIRFSERWSWLVPYRRPPVMVWRQLSGPVVALFSPTDTSLRYFVFLLLCALWALVVWSLFGGAITRIAALALAHDQRLPAGQALGYARSKFLHYFTAPLYPIAGALGAAVPLILIGLLLRFDAGVIIAGVLWPVVLLAGLFMAVLLVGLFFGWPLMWATISTEGTDSFDALSSSYAYVYQRPLHYFFYVAIAAVLAVLGWFVVLIFAGAVVELGNWAVSWGSGQARLEQLVPPAGPLMDSAQATEQANLDSLSQAGSTIIRFWIHCVQMLALAFASAYFWTASTAIYFLLRWHVDATEFDEAFTSKENDPYGLPPLKTDGAGVPDVADSVMAPAEPKAPAES